MSDLMLSSSNGIVSSLNFIIAESVKSIFLNVAPFFYQDTGAQIFFNIMKKIYHFYFEAIMFTMCYYCNISERRNFHKI